MEQLGYSQRKWALIMVLTPYSPWGIFLDREHQYFAFLVGSTQPGQESHGFPTPELVQCIIHEQLTAQMFCMEPVQPHSWAGDGCGLCKGKGKFTSKMRWKSSAESGQRVFQLQFTCCSWLIAPLLFFWRIHHQASELHYSTISGLTVLKPVFLKILKANLEHPILLILYMSVTLSSSLEPRGNLRSKWLQEKK